MKTASGNVVISRGQKIEITKLLNSQEYKYLFTSKHPGTQTCTEAASRCGFIMRSIDRTSYFKHLLSTKDEEYKDLGLQPGVM